MVLLFGQQYYLLNFVLRKHKGLYIQIDVSRASHFHNELFPFHLSSLNFSKTVNSSSIIFLNLFEYNPLYIWNGTVTLELC